MELVCIGESRKGIQQGRSTGVSILKEDLLCMYVARRNSGATY
jgi:hypothetical protein